MPGARHVLSAAKIKPSSKPVSRSAVSGSAQGRKRPGEAPDDFQQPAVRPLFAEPPTLASLPGLEKDVRWEVIGE